MFEYAFPERPFTSADASESGGVVELYRAAVQLRVRSARPFLPLGISEKLAHIEPFCEYWLGLLPFLEAARDDCWPLRCERGATTHRPCCTSTAVSSAASFASGSPRTGISIGGIS